MNKKGQALVEFVLILPIIMMILFVIIDFSNVFYQKNHLETVAGEITNLKKQGKENSYINKMYKENKITYTKENDILVIKVSKNIKLVTPFSNYFFKSPYTITTERNILNE